MWVTRIYSELSCVIGYKVHWLTSRNVRKFGREGGGTGSIPEFDLGHFIFTFHLSQLVRNGSEVKLRGHQSTILPMLTDVSPFP